MIDSCAFKKIGWAKELILFELAKAKWQRAPDFHMLLPSCKLNPFPSLGLLDVDTQQSPWNCPVTQKNNHSTQQRLFTWEISSERQQKAVDQERRRWLAFEIWTEWEALVIIIAFPNDPLFQRQGWLQGFTERQLKWGKKRWDNHFNYAKCPALSQWRQGPKITSHQRDPHKLVC